MERDKPNNITKRDFHGEFLFIVTGFASLCGQILLVRELLVIFHGTEITVGVFFGCWLAWIGVGAALGAWITRKFQWDFSRLFSTGIILLALSILVEILIIRASPAIFNIAPAELAPLRGVLVAGLLATGFTSLLTGTLFPVGCACLPLKNDRLISRLYALEALGGLLAGALFTFVLVRALNPIQITGIIIFISSVSAVSYGVRRGAHSPVVGSVTGALLIMVALACVAGFLSQTSIKLRWRALHPGLEMLVSTPSPHQHVELARLGKQFSLFGDGKIISSFPDPHSANRLSALVISQNPDASRLLLIGGGAGSLVGALLRYPLTRLDVIEPDPKVLSVAMFKMSGPEAAALEDARVNFITMDGRLFLNRFEGPKYDIILVNVPDPVSAFWNRNYTLEFFEVAKAALSHDGVLAISATSSENFWGPSVASYAGALYHTLKKVFAHVAATPGDETWFFASEKPGVVNLDPFSMKERFQSIKPKSIDFDPSAFQTMAPPERTRFVADQLTKAPELINRDLDPVSLTMAMILWGRFAGEDGLSFLTRVREAGAWVFVVPIGLFLLFQFPWFALSSDSKEKGLGDLSLFAMFTVAFTAMGGQLVLIYAYQSLFGYLFEQIGLLSALFMCGLAFSAWLTGAILWRITRKSLAVAGIMTFMAICLALTPPLLQWLSRISGLTLQVAVFTWILVLGSSTGAAFALCASMRFKVSGQAAPAAGAADSADHLGAALGAFLVAGIMTPLLGARQACLIMAFWLLGQAFLMVAIPWFQRIGRAISRALANSQRPSFPYLKLTWSLIFIVCLAIAWNLLVGAPGWKARTKFSQDLLSRFMDTEDLLYRPDPFPHYSAKSDDSSSMGFALATYPLAPDVRGYNGPLNLLLVLDDRGIIHELSLIQSRETPSYLPEVIQWLEGFKGLSLKKPLEERVDTVTGATITSRAILKTVSRTRLKLGDYLFPMDKMAQQKAEPVPERFDLRLLLVPPILAIFFTAFLSGARIMRLISMAMGFLLLGVSLNMGFSSMDIFQISLRTLPGGDFALKSILLAGVLLSATLWGQAFCGYLCPFGALQEAVHFPRMRLSPSHRASLMARYLKFVIFAALIVLVMVTGHTTWAYFSPLVYFFNFQPGLLEFCLIAGVLFSGVFYFRFWCRYLCPAGAFLALFNKISLLRGKSPPIAPGRCDLGVSHVNDVDCIRCHRCLNRESVSRDQSDRWGERADFIRPNTILALSLILCMALSAAIVVSKTEDRAIAIRPLGGREIDVERVKRLISEGELSEREAMFYKKIRTKE